MQRFLEWLLFVIVCIVYYTDGDDTLHIWNDKNNQAVQSRVCETLPVVVSAAAVMMSQFCSHNNLTNKLYKKMEL